MSHYVHGRTRQPARNVQDALAAEKRRHKQLVEELGRIRAHNDALEVAARILAKAEEDARLIREQAYDFGMAQLDRDYPTRQHRDRERMQAKDKLVSRYGRQRLEAATAEYWGLETKTPTGPTGPDHGDWNRYRAGCRCRKCRAANAAKMREYRALKAVA